MNISARPSLETVSWRNRVIAIAIGLVTAMLLYFPSRALNEAITEGRIPTLQNLVQAAQFGIAVMKPFFAGVFAGMAGIWGLPGLVVLYWGLSRHWNVFAYVAGGAVTGMVGYLISDDWSHGNIELTKLLFATPFHEDQRLIWLVGGICGAGAGAASWVYMRLVHSRQMMRMLIRA